MPYSEYQSRLAARRLALAAAQSDDERTANRRLVVFALALAIAVARVIGGVSPWLFAIPAFAWVFLWASHHRVRERLARARLAVGYYERALRRLGNDWAGGGRAGDRFNDPHHPYALDLDCFGAGSLFERLCTAQTSAGEEVLADWLLRPAEPQTIRARQEGAAELRDALDWREQIACQAAEGAGTLHLDVLLAWAEAPRQPIGPAAPWWLLGASSLTAGAAIAIAVFGAPGYWILPPLAAQSVIAGRYRRVAAAILGDIDEAARELDRLARLMVCFEREPWRSPALVALRGRLEVDGLLPSRQIRTLRRLVDWLDARRNQIFTPVAALVAWGTHFAFALERWRRRNGAAVASWCAAVGEIEALAALAAYTYENPEDVFATFVEGEPRVEGSALGHPLLPAASAVRNDLVLDDRRRLYLISGSNMSGKSTFLRTLGANVVLAQLGAPVRARALTLTPLAVGATLRVQDSLREGASRFYAEIVRLRQIVDLTRESRPVLFLLDEILHGTNSHDRLAGATAILRGLLGKRAIGAVTTHDLALTQVALELGPQVRNVYFADHFENGQMHFDYRMREGVISKSNALELMRSVGLEV